VFFGQTTGGQNIIFPFSLVPKLKNKLLQWSFTEDCACLFCRICMESREHLFLNVPSL